MKLGKYEFYPEKPSFLWKDGERVEYLTRIEGDVLRLLIEKDGDLFTRDDYYNVAGNKCCNSNVRTAFAKLRKKLREAGSLIITDRERGYYFENKNKKERSKKIKLGKYEFDSKYIFKNGKRVSRLTKLQSEILCRLIEKNGDTLTNEEYREISGYPASYCGIRSVFSNIRKKLFEAGSLILKDRNRGYYLCVN